VITPLNSDVDVMNLGLSETQRCILRQAIRLDVACEDEEGEIYIFIGPTAAADLNEMDVTVVESHHVMIQDLSCATSQDLVTCYLSIMSPHESIPNPPLRVVREGEMS